MRKERETETEWSFDDVMTIERKCGGGYNYLESFLFGDMGFGMAKSEGDEIMKTVTIVTMVL